MQPDELGEGWAGPINKNVASVLEGNHLHKTFLSCATLEMYNEPPIFVPVNITEDTVKSVAQKLLEAPGPGGTGSEAL